MERKKITYFAIQALLLLIGIYSLLGLFDPHSWSLPDIFIWWFPNAFNRWWLNTYGYYHIIQYSILSFTCFIVVLGLSINKKWALFGGLVLFTILFVSEVHRLLVPIFAMIREKLPVLYKEFDILIPFALCCLVFIFCIQFFAQILLHKRDNYFSKTPISELFKPTAHLIFETIYGKFSTAILIVLITVFLLSMHVYFFELEYSSKLQQRFVSAQHYSPRHDFYIYIAEHPHKRFTRYLITEINENKKDLITTNEYCLHAHFRDAIKNVTGESFGFDYDRWVKWYEKKYNIKFIPFHYYEAQ
jgi:hypothetical protein